jgi:hypothetical protein
MTEIPAEQPINIENLSLRNILSVITLSQAYKIASTSIVMVAAVFWSGYATAEYNYRQEKFKAEMFEAVVQMWQASDEHAMRPKSEFNKTSLTNILNHAPAIGTEDLEYLNAKSKLKEAINRQHAWQLRKNKNGQTVLQCSDSEFIVPSLDQHVRSNMPKLGLVSLTIDEQAHQDIFLDFKNKVVDDYNAFDRYFPFVIPLTILTLVFGFLFKVWKNKK